MATISFIYADTDKDIRVDLKHAHHLDDILNEFELFIRSSGFYFNGHLVIEDECIVEEQEPNQEAVDLNEGYDYNNVPF